MSLRMIFSQGEDDFRYSMYLLRIRVDEQDEELETVPFELPFVFPFDPPSDRKALIGFRDDDELDCPVDAVVDVETGTGQAGGS